VHIDRLHVVGPLDHKPLGELFYKELDENTVIPVGASAFKPMSRRNPDCVYIRSRDVQSNGRAHELEFDCCPTKLLQKHNFFGHGDPISYTYAAFDLQTRKFGLAVSAEQREQWRTGQVSVTGLHLCANFWCPENAQLSIIDGIDENVRGGKHRDEATCITLGFTPKRRSQYHTVTTYAKAVLLAQEWPRPGPYQSRILAAARRSIRVEIKLYSQWLKRRGLGYVMRWRDVDVNAIFFEVLAQYRIRNAVQALLTADERKLLSAAEQRAYLLWLNGESLQDHFCRSTVWKYVSSIEAKTGISLRGQRRPDALPAVNLADILVPENIVPVPSWAHGSPYYWAPGQAGSIDDELDGLAY
jgi:hypothetical protein